MIFALFHSLYYFGYSTILKLKYDSEKKQQYNRRVFSAVRLQVTPLVAKPFIKTTEL
jgi:hypothetical protein